MKFNPFFLNRYPCCPFLNVFYQMLQYQRFIATPSDPFLLPTNLFIPTAIIVTLLWTPNYWSSSMENDMSCRSRWGRPLLMPYATGQSIPDNQDKAHRLWFPHNDAVYWSMPIGSHIHISGAHGFDISSNWCHDTSTILDKQLMSSRNLVIKTILRHL